MQRDREITIGRQNLATTTFKKLWKNQYFQTAIVIILIGIVVFGLWFGTPLVMGTKIFPALAVVSGSMCIPYDGACEGWLSVNHPFDRTLHKGDIIIIQGVDPATLNTNYPNSDIIVFHRPDNYAELIVHRIASVVTDANGKLSFYTKGDGNPPVKWPAQTTGYDGWGLVSEDLVVGKVVMRVPWVGWVSIVMSDLTKGSIGAYIVPIIVVLIVLLIIIEFIVPLFKKKQTEKQKNFSKTTDLQN
jgi:signal peptidase I